MAKKRITLSMESSLVAKIDSVVLDRRCASRSEFIESAVSEQLRRIYHHRLAAACALLDPAEERALAEEGITGIASESFAY